jgi:hemerythrin
MGTEDQSPHLGFAIAAMHATRRELAQSMSSLASADDDRVADCYNRLVAALEHVFQAEELVTENIDQQVLHEQRERHARALSALHQAATRIDDGDAALAREALSLLGRFLIAGRANAPLKTGSPAR